MPRNFKKPKPRSCARCGVPFTPKPGGSHAKRCPSCRPLHEREVKARYHTPAHKAMRESLAREVASGRAVCARCRMPIAPGSPWDVGHVDGGGPFDFSGAEHRACNRRTNGRDTTPRRWEFRDGLPALVPFDDSELVIY